MGETVERFRPSFNRSVIVEGSEAKQSSDAGLVLVREVLERTGLFAALSEQLDDPRAPERVTHSLADQLRTLIGLLAQGWGDLADVEGQAEDAVLRVATRSCRGLTPLNEALPSQSTLSRLLGILAAPINRAMLHEAAVGLAGQRPRAANNGHRKQRLTVDVDGAGIEVAGHKDVLAPRYRRSHAVRQPMTRSSPATKSGSCCTYWPTRPCTPCGFPWSRPQAKAGVSSGCGSPMCQPPTIQPPG